MDALITGATGFIGSRLAERLANAGHNVIAFGAEHTPLEAARRRGLEALGIRVETGKLDDLPLLRRLAESADTVFHLAAAQHESNFGIDYFRAVNVCGTRNLLDACEEAGVERFVYGSTIGVYGSARNAPLDERSATHPDNIYAVTKLAAESVVQSFSSRLPVTIIRISETYGPGDHRLLKLFRAVARGTFPMIGGGRNEHQPIYVDDLIEGLWLAATRDAAEGQTFVLAGSEVIATRRYVELVAAAVGGELRSVDLPLTPFWLAAVSLEKALKPIGVQPPWHRRRLDFFVKRFYFSLEKARRLLGFEPEKEFSQGTAETAGWYRAQGFL